MNNTIRVGITQGDINSISYEVIIKALAAEGITELCTPVIFGSGKILAYYRKNLGIENFNVNQIYDPSQARHGVVNLVNITEEEYKIEPGKCTPQGGIAALESLRAATEALRAGEIDVLVTAPINKEAIQSDEFRFPGHTEYLEKEIGAEGEKALMVLFNDMMRVALVTTHLPLKEVASAITKDKVADKIREFNTVLKRDFGIDGPKIAVLSLNPHCGDGGLLGTEETDCIFPAVEETFSEGILAFGPYAADGFFGGCREIMFDGILAMYHDQGLIPLKASSSDNGVNFTGGLQYVRTSPDHGTAFDIAGKGKASGASMREAIFQAIDIFKTRARYDRSVRNPLRKQYVERGADKTVDLSAEPEEP